MFPVKLATKPESQNMSSTSKPVYKRILLKLSGEALMGDQGYGVDPATITRIAKEIKDVRDLKVELAIVVGGGNIFRGVAGSARGMDRASADYMGMLATVMNALALQDALEKQDVFTRVMTAIEMRGGRAVHPPPRHPPRRERARGHLRRRHRQPLLHDRLGRGPSRPRNQGQCHTQGDQGRWHLHRRPEDDSTATMFDRITYLDVIQRDLKVMDTSAISLCRERGVPITSSIYIARQHRARRDGRKGRDRRLPRGVAASKQGTIGLTLAVLESKI